MIATVRLMRTIRNANASHYRYLAVCALDLVRIGHMLARTPPDGNRSMDASDAIGTAEDRFADVTALMRQAEYLQAFDAAEGALEAFPDSEALRHQAVLALARSGAVGQALKAFEEHGLARIRSEDMLSLHGRLYKDLGLAAGGAERRRLLDAAIGYYADAYSVSGGAYPAINVATIAALAGERAQVNDWAGRVLAHAEMQAPDPTYYALASQAEALLLLRRSEDARAVVAAAAAAPDIDFAARAATLKQLRLICGHLDLNPDILAPLQPPAVAHYCGHIVSAPGATGRFPADQTAQVAAEIAEAFRRRPISRAVGSLAAGADILAAEAALAAGAALDVVLPFDLEEFVEISVRPAGGDWERRMRACLQAAAQAHYVTEEAYLGDDALFGYATEYAIGLTLLRARFLAADACQLAVWDGDAGGPDDVAGTWSDMEKARRAGMAQDVVRVQSNRGGAASGAAAPAPAPKRLRREPRCLLFGDFKGFSKLTDVQLPVYVDEVLGACAAVLDARQAHLTFRNTWGDGLFMVFDDIAAAADCAFALQAAVTSIDHAALGLPDTLGLRLGFHYGPVYETVDPVLGRKNCFGFHVSRAARVEPITPEKSVFATEQTAAALAVHCGDAYRAEYVGQMPLAKGYGSFRMYHLQPT